jgi:hypothetical protein
MTCERRTRTVNRPPMTRQRMQRALLGAGARKRSPSLIGPGGSLAVWHPLRQAGPVVSPWSEVAGLQPQLTALICRVKLTYAQRNTCLRT